MMRSTYVEGGLAKEASETFVLTVVNGAEQTKIVQEMGVRIYPTTYIFDPTYGLIDRIEGFVPADQLRKRLAVATRRLAQASSPKTPR
jgi:thioredoxin-like negative regulator of GroEL